MTVSPEYSPPSPLTAPFWDAAAESRLVRPVCDCCDRNFFTPQICCPSCQSEAWTYQESAGMGAVYSFSVVHRAPAGDRATPYVVAIIDLDEGWQMMSNITSCRPQQVHIGQRVGLDWQERDGVKVPTFRPQAISP